MISLILGEGWMFVCSSRRSDSSITAYDCEGIIRKRSGCGDDKRVPVAAADWVKLCGKLGKKYGEDPLAMG